MAIGPIDYTSMQIQPNIAQNFGQGLQVGLALQQAQEQKQQREQDAKLQAQYASDLQSAMQNPTPQNMAAMIAKYPQQKDALAGSFKYLTDDQQKSELNSATQVYSSLLKGNTDVAKSVINDHIAAMENSGQDASSLKTLRDTIENDPKAAIGHAGLVIASIMGPEKFSSVVSQLGEESRKEQLQPYAIVQKGAEASQAVTAAQNAPTANELANAKTAQDIANSQNQQKLNALDVQIKQANSETDRGKLQLERDKLQASINQQQQKATGTPAEAQNTMDTLTSTLATVDNLQNSPYLKSSLDQEGWLNTKVGTIAGKITSMIPGTQAHDFDATIETLKSQQFLAQAKQLKGMGALSDAEGARLEKAVSSLDRDMSPKAFNASLGVIRSTLNKAQQKLAVSGALPTQAGTGTVVATVPGHGNIYESDVNRLMAQMPGATRQDVIDFLGKLQGKNNG